MNKLILDKEEMVLIENNALYLEINVPQVNIMIKGQVLLNEIVTNKEEVEINIHVLPNSSLLYNCYQNHKKMKKKVNLSQDNNSTLIYNYSFIAENTSLLEVNSKSGKEESKTEINIAAVTEDKGNVKIISTGDIPPTCYSITMSENIKILTLNEGENSIVPNLLVASDEVTVNHAATIGGVSENDIFYLMSKGISEERASSLLKTGFLIHNLSLPKEDIENIKSKIKEV